MTRDCPQIPLGSARKLRCGLACGACNPKVHHYCILTHTNWTINFPILLFTTTITLIHAKLFSCCDMPAHAGYVYIHVHAMHKHAPCLMQLCVSVPCRRHQDSQPHDVAHRCKENSISRNFGPGFRVKSAADERARSIQAGGIRLCDPSVGI